MATLLKQVIWILHMMHFPIVYSKELNIVSCDLHTDIVLYMYMLYST